MSKATNNTQRVTFGKAQATYGFRSERTIFLDGHNVGTIEKEGQNCGYNVSIRMEDEEGNTVRAFDRCFDIEHDGIRYDNPSVALRQAKGYVLEVLASAQVSRTHVKACGNAGFSWVEIAEEPAQGETVEVEEAAQADDTEIVYSVDFLGFDLDGREFRVSEYGTARAAHAAAKEFARSRADYGDQVRFEAFHGNGNSKIQTIYFNGFASGYIEKTVEMAEEAGTARLLALIFDEEEQAQAETAEAEEPAQAFAPGDAVIATYKGAQSRGVVVREYVCPDHRKGYPDERFYSSPEDPVYVVKVRGKDREIAYRASHLKRCLEAHA